MLNCKCACGPTNSTIVPIESCVACKISLCLAIAQHDAKNTSLPYRPDFVCQPSQDTQLNAICFDRERTLDKVLVSLFLVLLAALAFTAVFRPWMEMVWMHIRRRMYRPVFSSFHTNQS
ncbi:hypothetical protein BCR44DRAFT_36492 [Catenaria anguillulae PL171]|uniref:Uncharacterized protein n=1 Tax=Catenaria anguillulae PL171 TaxID=765915 RepID=A0A1Y2I2P0_9FUNG|nr:hypothetical protein BCR44DRAFT_36492 [Catenaria anguillulae PL171]